MLSRTGDGTASAALISAVDRVLSADDVRPLTDHVTVQSASIVPFQVNATIYFFAGPDREVVMRAVRASVERYVADVHRLGRDVTLSGVYAALHLPGVQRVELAQPAATLVINRTQAAYCTAINLTDGGVDE